MVIKMNGYIEQWGKSDNNENTPVTTTFPVQYSTSNTVFVYGLGGSRTQEVSTDNLLLYEKTLTDFKTKWHNHGPSSEWYVEWQAKGY